MKILHFIAFIMFPISIANNGYTMKMECDEYDEIETNQNKNQKQDKFRRSVVKFENGNNRCGLASLNQILSVLNPGNNKLLKGFIDKYNILLNKNNNKNKVYEDPAFILGKLLKDTNDLYNKECLLKTKDVDVVERYESLFNISKELNCNINDVNAYITLPEDKKDLQKTVTEISNKGAMDVFGRDPKINNNTLNLVLCCDNMTIFNNFSQDICNESLSINNSEFELVSVSFLQVGKDGKLKEGKASHFVSAKKLPNGKWIMIDSSDANFTCKETNYIYNTFEDLVKDRVKYNKNHIKTPYNGEQYLYPARLLPRLLCYKKKDNNKTNTINQHNNININNNFSSIDNSIHNSYNNTTNYNTITNNYKNSNNKIFYNIYDSMESDDDSGDSTPTFGSPRTQKEQHNEFSSFNSNEELDEEEFNVFSRYNKENDYNKHGKESTNDISKVNINNNKYNYNSKNNEIQNQRKLEEDFLQLLEASLKNDGYDLSESMNVINDLYENKNMRALIIKNCGSKEIRDYLRDFGYEYLWKYIEIISNIFHVHQQIEQLSN